MTKSKIGMTHPHNRMIVFASIGLLILSTVLLVLLFLFSETTLPLKEMLQARISEFNHGERACEFSDVYNDFLAQTAVDMLSHPDSSNHSLSELEALFSSISGQHLDIISGNEVTSALILQRFKYESCAEANPIKENLLAYIIDSQAKANSLGGHAEIYDMRWLEDRWLIFAKQAVDDTAYMLEQVYDNGQYWQSWHQWDFPPSKTPPTINYLDAYRTLMLDYVDSSTKAPCKFNRLVNFFSNEEGMQITYQWINNTYAKVDENYRNIQIWTKDNIINGESVPVDNWQDYCIS